MPHSLHAAGESSTVHVSAVNYFQQLSHLLLATQITTLQEEVLSLDEGAKAAARILRSVRSKSGKVMLIGNGGSAAIASHMQNDLCKSVGVRSLVFNEPPLLTALSNDHGYECVFERPVGLWADADDLMVAFSSSGRSENILRAVRAAEMRGCKVITFSGFQPTNPLRRMGNVNFYVASQVYGYVEVAHGALGHFLTDCCSMQKSEAASVGI
jgi:D-sedoheptulose 7-phosphate isomerase